MNEDKTQMEVTIFGQTLKLRGDADPEMTLKLAEFVDQKMREAVPSTMSLSNVLYNPKKRQVTPERIAKAVADYYGVQMDALKGQKRDKAIVTPRQVAMFLMREETDVSLLRIGAELGGRDHSTVLHACDKITRESAVNDELRREIAAVRELIYAD